MLKIIIIQIVVTSFALSQGFVINESMSKNINTIFDEDGSSPDWIEIYNSNLNSQDIGGFFLSDNKNELNKWEFPEGSLEPQSHLLVFTSDKNKNIWPQGEWVPLINLGATWNYKEGSATIPPNWNNISFDDSGWNAGASSIGYGDNDDMTTVDPVVSVYMRKIFTIADTSAISHGLLHMDYDDGFVAHINGNEIARKNLGIDGSNIPFNQFADTNVEAKIYLGLRPEKFIIEDIKEYLNQGENIISLQVHNASNNLIDLTASPVLSFFYTNPPEPSETTNITIRLKTDNYPQETSWSLTGINNTIYNQQQAIGSLNNSNHDYEWSLNVPQGDYQFAISDTWGDGICCVDGIAFDIYNNDFEIYGGWNSWPTDVNSNNWNAAQGQGHNESFQSLEVYGSSSAGSVNFYQTHDVYNGQEHQLDVFAKNNADNPIQLGQSALAVIEFYGWGWFGSYLISQHTSNILDHNSNLDEWYKLSVSAVAPEEATSVNIIVTFSNPNGQENGSVFFDDVSFKYKAHQSLSDEYTPGEYSVFVDGSKVINNELFTYNYIDTINTQSLFSDILDFQKPHLHTNFKISSGGETIYLSNQSEIIIDSLFVPEMEENISFGYQNDGNGVFQLFDNVTPGYTNNLTQGYGGYTSKPVFSDSGGFKTDYFNLYLNTDTDDEIIYYTTDGSKPNMNSNVYNNFIPINAFLLTNGTQTADDYGIELEPTYNGIIIRAFAVSPNSLPSEIVTNSYIFDPVNATLPVVSISIDPEDLWNSDTGMYVAGDSYLPWYPYYGANFWEDWEKEVHIEFFEPGGEIGFKQNLGMKIFGGWSRAEIQKSFSFFARSQYGNGSIEYELFPESDISNFESFILRAHGQDNVMFRDGFHATLAKKNGVVTQDYRPAVLYLNGEFWGIQNIREKVNEHFIETHFNIDQNNVDLVAVGSSTSEPQLVHGSIEDYNEVNAFITSNDLSLSGNYQIAAEKYDIQNLIEYHIAQIFVMNFDWPGNNNKLFKSKANTGKWRHVMYDTDFGFERWTDGVLTFVGGYQDYNMLNHTYSDVITFNNPIWSTEVFTSFLSNQSFRTKFINTYCDRINTTYSTENTLYVMDSLKTIIEPYISDHINRYGPSIYDSYTPNNMNEYNSAIQLMENFAQYRPENAMNEMVESFNLNGSRSTISIFSSDLDMGHVALNTLKIDRQGWTGEYFTEIPLKIKAVSKFGYEFSHWEGISSPTDSATILLNNNISVTAHFNTLENPFQNLIVINEINYNSSDDFDSGDWVELVNNSIYPADLTGWKFLDEDDSHIYSLPDSLVIQAGGYLVLCQDTSSFLSVFPTVNNYVGELGYGFSGGGELLRLMDSTDALVDYVEYDDSNPWPLNADGNGSSLELTNYELDNTIATSWAASVILNGTPGVTNSTYSVLKSESNALVPNVYALHQNYPNPFNPTTTIKYDIPKDTHILINIFDLKGRLVKTLIDEYQISGFKTIKWDATNKTGQQIAAGMYIYRIKAGNYSETKKMVLLK